ncbi:MAG: hypothetical protein MI922_03555 [Bacteroidales bacterium]|nr:hypothetical protein [Bacteroidales bacterium]
MRLINSKLQQLLQVDGKWIVSAVILLVSTYTHAQQLDNLKEQQPVTINGFISTNQVLNTQPTDSTTEFVYNGFYTGSLNFNFYGINTPFTFVYSNHQGNFTHPFNQYGLHPSWKWVKGHIGYASMNFTPYTLSGHLFYGAGVELTPPGIFRFSAMYGRLKKEVEYDSTEASLVPAYKRMGYAVKTGVEKDGDFVHITLFRAYDKENSIKPLPAEMELAPQENSVMSVTFNKILFKKLTFNGEYASSYMTTDSQTEVDAGGSGIMKPPTWFMPVRTSTINRNALKAGIAYNHERFSVGAGYERIDPEYATLGSYYFNNNFENATLNLSANFFQNKVSISGNGGLQRDNIDQSKLNNNVRFVGSGNVSTTPNERISFNLSYSNFLSYTNTRSTFDYINETDPLENWDTLNYRQVSQTIGGNGSFQLSGNEQRRQSLSMNLTYQTSNDQQGTDTNSISVFYNANTSYILSLVPLDMNISASVNFNRNETPQAGSYTVGPSLNVSKLFLKKTLRTNLSGAYNIAHSDVGSNAQTFNIRVGTAYTIKKQHNLNLNYLFQHRSNASNNNQVHNFTFGYVYNFSLIKNKQNNNNETNDPTSDNNTK